MKNKHLKPKSNETEIFLRYLFLALLTFFITNEKFFLNIMIDLYTNLSYFFLSLITNVTLSSGKLLLIGQNKIFLIVKECIGQSAYILIAAIFLTIPIKTKKQIEIIGKAFLLFSVLNLLRIYILMSVNVFLGEHAFNKVHMLFFEGLTGVIVGFIIVYFLKKNEIKKTYPILTDVKYLIKKIKPQKVEQEEK